MNVIKIGAVWCNGCLVMRPRWKEIEEEYPRLVTEYYDFDKDKDVINRFHVESGTLPVCIFLDKKGKELLRLHGEVDKQKLISTIMIYKDM